MNVSKLQASNNLLAFKNIKNNPKTNKETKNPITQKGEAANLAKATFLGGVALGGRLLWELFDGDFLYETAGDTAKKLVNKNKSNVKGIKKTFCYIGATIGIITAGVAGFAAIYTLLNIPKIAYNSKVNKFTKEKEMDVYIKSNEAEKNIYKQLADKAKNADETERQHLQNQYSKMVLAKNQVPDFINIKNKNA